MKQFISGSRQRLTVLMYHKVTDGNKGDFLTVPLQQLKEQFKFLQEQGYHPVKLSDLVAFVQQGKALPSNPLLISFDDGYKDNYTFMYPLLVKFGMKANIFLTPSFLNKEDYLNIEDIHAMDPDQVEFGLHSYDHKSYKKLSPAEITNDIIETKAALLHYNIGYQPCLAFPFGAYPKYNLFKRKHFFNTLRSQGIVLAFRIGNRFNSLPLPDPLLIQRLDIRGDDTMEKFMKQLSINK